MMGTKQYQTHFLSQQSCPLLTTGRRCKALWYWLHFPNWELLSWLYQCWSDMHCVLITFKDPNFQGQHVESMEILLIICLKYGHWTNTVEMYEAKSICHAVLYMAKKYVDAQILHTYVNVDMPFQTMGTSLLELLFYKILRPGSRDLLPFSILTSAINVGE